uniref:Uncharacterized protein n=1 Tax=Anopheles atroparvus TaxID=41427 RepID=A0AAG5DUT8_ANOAO
ANSQSNENCSASRRGTFVVEKLNNSVYIHSTLLLPVGRWQHEREFSSRASSGASRPQRSWSHESVLLLGSGADRIMRK